MTSPHINTAHKDNRPETDLISLALHGLYKHNKILACGLDRLDKDSSSISFIFPPYEKGIEEGHVSANQINEAIMEAVFCALALSVSDGTFDYSKSLDWFVECRTKWIAFKQEVTYRRMLEVGEEAVLIVSNLSTREKRIKKSFLSLSASFNGFASGEIEWLLPRSSKEALR